MKFPRRTRQSSPQPGVSGPLRVYRRNTSGMAHVSAGDVVLIDHVDLDRTTAQALVDAGVVAVLHRHSIVSGRYPSRGPQVLVDAGVVVVDRLGEALDDLRAGDAVRVHGGEVHRGDATVGRGRDLDAEQLAGELDDARSGMATQLTSFAHNSTEFVRREQDVLLHGEGVPRLRSRIEGRPVVVVVDAHDWKREVRGLKPFLREQRPVVVGVGGAVDGLAEAGIRSDVVVVSPSDPHQPRAKALKKATDVVVLVDRGAAASVMEPYERIGLRPLRFETGATSEDAALLVSAESGARLIVGAGMHATLDDFLDRRRPGLASTFLTRLRVGPTLVDAAAVPSLYDGAVRPRHVVATLLAGLLAVGVAVGVTPVGQEWLGDLNPAVAAATDYVRGLLP